MSTEYAPRISREGEFSELVRAKLAELFLPRAEWDEPNALPTYAGTRSHTWKTPVYNGESPNLVAAREIVAGALAGQHATEVLFIGDSKTEGSGLLGDQAGFTGQWSYPAQVRRTLAARDGLIVANVTAGDSRWTLANMGRAATDRNGVIPAPAGDTTKTKSAQLATGPCTGGTVWALATGGASITLTVDGTTSTVVLPAKSDWQAVPTGELADGTHTVKVASTSDFDVLGMALTHSAPGLRISRAGRSSSSASQWLPAGPTSGHWKSVVESPATTPDVIVCQHGTNAASDTDSLAALYAGLAGLGIPVIIVSPGGLGELHPASTYAAARKVLYDAADAYDFPLIDFEAVIGEYGAANGKGLMGDVIHENGRGYALEAAAINRLISTAAAACGGLPARDTGVQDITAQASNVTSGQITFQHKNGWNTITFTDVKVSAAGTSLSLFANNNPTLKPWAPGVAGVNAGSASESVVLGAAGTDYRRVTLNYTGGLNAYEVKANDVLNGTIMWPMNRPLP